MIEPLFRDSGRSVKKLLSLRKPMYTHKSGLVAAVERADDNHVVIVEEPLLPEGYYSGQNFLKRGPFVRLNLESRIETIREQARQGKILGPSRTRNEQFKRIPSGDYAGYAWSILDGKELRHVLLTYCIEGTRLWDLCTRESPESLVVTKAKDYRSNAESSRYGWTFDVDVPSFSGKGTYKLKMKHVAIDHVPDEHLAWRAMKSEDHAGGMRLKGGRHEGCEFKYYITLTHRRPPTVTACLHDVVVHRAISEWARREGKGVILQPYALPSQEVVRFYNKLCRQTLVEEKVKNAKGLNALQRRFLRVPELENALWQYVQAHRDRNVFYATSQLRSYRWDY